MNDFQPIQNTSRPPRQSESGNVLFYILIAVALIAALSYAISQSTRGGGADAMNAERASISASEILEFGNTLHSAVTQLNLRGCNDTEFNFANSGSLTTYSNSGAPSGNICDIFHVSGGGVSYLTPQDDWLDSSYSGEDNYGEFLFTGDTCVPGNGQGVIYCLSEGDSAADLIVALPYIKKEICITINEKLGVENSGTDGDPPKDAGKSWKDSSPAYDGSYDNGVDIRDTPEALVGKNAGCFESDTYPVGGYHYYKVLRAR